MKGTLPSPGYLEEGILQESRKVIIQYRLAILDEMRLVHASLESVEKSKRVLAAAERLLQNIYS